MSQSKKNKHGLSRYIKASVKEKIRRDAGFGCVFCGCVLVEYEHIEPEFHNAKEHDPGKMTLLCPMCHDKVTKKHISKNKVWKAKESPKALKDGYVRDTLFVATDSLDINIGNARTSMMAIAIKLYGKPLFWFEPHSTEDGEEFRVCCIFYGPNGQPIAYINRNEYIAIVGKPDIVSKGSSLKITDKKLGCLLEISREGDEPLHIKRLFAQLYSTKVIIDGEDSPIRFGDINLSNNDLSSIGGLTLAGSGYTPNGLQTALALGGVPVQKLFNPIASVIITNLYGKVLRRFDGSIIGWQLGNKLINKSHKFVGIIEGLRIKSIAGEFIANLVNDQILYPSDQYESGEPIFVIPNDRKSRNARITNGYDLSYRFTS